MVYYHPGIIVEIFSPRDRDIESSDSSTQALIETWDENVISYEVDPKIAEDVKVGDVVLIDYNPTSQQPFRPKMIVVKILRGEKGKKTWDAYKEYFKKRPKMKTPQMPPMSQPSYVG